MTLNDLKRQIESFTNFWAISGCDTSLYHLQGGVTELSLCDPNQSINQSLFVSGNKNPYHLSLKE